MKCGVDPGQPGGDSSVFSYHVHNTDKATHRFLSDVCALFCDPNEEQQRRLLTEGKAAVRMDRKTGRLLFTPDPYIWTPTSEPERN